MMVPLVVGGMVMCDWNTSLSKIPWTVQATVIIICW